MIILDGNKKTANQLAKEIVLEYGMGNSDYWQESVLYEEVVDKATEREIEEINKAIDKQTRRVRKFLGI